MELDNEVVQTLIDQGKAIAAVQVVAGGNIPFAIVPNGYSVRALGDMVYNEHSPTPERIKQKVGVLDPESFTEYWDLFSDPNSRIFADESKLTVQAILDFHGAKEGGPRWGQHQVTLTLRQSEEWKRWTAYNNKHLTQVEFAEFLEQNSIDITKPTPAAMMEVATDLQAKTDVEFGSGVKSADGSVKFKYTETTKASVGAGNLSVPDQFIVTISPFVGGDRIDVQALLRFRTNAGKLVFWFTLIRPEEVIRKAFMAARDKIATKLGVVILNGNPQG